MISRNLSLWSAIAVAMLATACEQNRADDVAKARKEAQDEIARIQRESDQKIADARREADQKIAEAKQEAAKDTARVQRDVTEEQRELQKEIQNAKQETKEEYKDYAAKRARLVELRAAELKAKAAAAPAEARSDFDKQLQEIDAKRTSVLGSLKELDKAGKDTWGSVKAKVDTELNDLEKRVETIGQKM